MGIPRVFGQQKAGVSGHRNEPDRDDTASQSSAMSLHEDIDFERTDDELLPPPYVDDPDAVAIASPTTGHEAGVGDRQPVCLQLSPGQLIQKYDAKGSTTVWLSTSYTSDPVALQQYIEAQIWCPPQAIILIHGEHTETHDDGKNKKKDTKVDFDIKINVTNTISRRKTDEEGRTIVPEWSEVTSVSELSHTYRGSFKKSYDKIKRPDVEGGISKASIEEWCHLFCASSSKLKSFTIRHFVENRNEELLRDRIIEIIRATNYRGRITVRFELRPRTVTFQTPHLFNKLRHNKFVYYLFIILQLWIITWPILFFMTRRWEVVYVKWPYRKRFPVQGRPNEYTWACVKEREKDWAKDYRLTIQEGVLSKAVNGTWIDYIPQDESWRANERERSERERQAREAEPQGGFVGGALSLMRGVSNIIQENNAVRGWGYDT